MPLPSKQSGLPPLPPPHTCPNPLIRSVMAYVIHELTSSPSMSRRGGIWESFTPTMHCSSTMAMWAGLAIMHDESACKRNELWACREGCVPLAQQLGYAE